MKRAGARSTRRAGPWRQRSQGEKPCTRSVDAGCNPSTPNVNTEARARVAGLVPSYNPSEPYSLEEERAYLDNLDAIEEIRRELAGLPPLAEERSRGAAERLRERRASAWAVLGYFRDAGGLPFDAEPSLEVLARRAWEKLPHGERPCLRCFELLPMGRLSGLMYCDSCMGRA